MSRQGSMARLKKQRKMQREKGVKPTISSAMKYPKDLERAFKNIYYKMEGDKR